MTSSVEKVAGVNSDRHFDKGESFERQQAKLDETSDVEMIVEGCFFAAHHYICAGADWHGTAHPTSHAHARTPHLLNQAGAPLPVKQAWDELDRLRVGNVYGGRP